MKKLISFSAFAFIVLMVIAAHAAQAQVIVRPYASPVVASVGVGFGAYPRPYCYGRGYRYVRRPYPIGAGYYPRPHFYGRPAVRVRVW